MAETTRGKDRNKESLPSLEDAIGWDGKQIDGLGNKTLGRIAGIHVDANDGEPRWPLIRLGPLAGCTAIPFEHVAEYGGRIAVWPPLGVCEELPAVGEVDRHIAGPRFVRAALDRDALAGEGAADLRQLDERQAAAAAAADVERVTGPLVRP